MGQGIYIDMSSIDRKAFRVSQRVHDVAGDIYLITPGFDKHVWERDELHLRSLIVRADGEILCSGFSKFKNYGENEEDDLLIRQLIADNKVLFTEKMDGSCIIRTVINDVVCFRTRGSHTLGEGFEELVMNLVNDKYPKLMDSSLMNDVSVLFEFTAPDNQIILKYDESALTCIGTMVYNHESGLPTFVGNAGIVNNVAGIFGVDAVSFHDMPSDLDQAVEAIRSWSGSEGIVVWGNKPDGTMLLIKIKAEEYIRLHSLRYQLSGDKIKKLCWIKGIETHDQLKAEMHKLGVDWEFVSFILNDFDEYINALNYIRQRIAEIKLQIDSEGIRELPTMKRKALALKRLYSIKREFAIGIEYCKGNYEYLDRAVYSSALEIPMNALKTLQDTQEEYSKYGF